MRFGTERGNGPIEINYSTIDASKLQSPTAIGARRSLKGCPSLSQLDDSMCGSGSGKRMSRKERQEKKLLEMQAKNNVENCLPAAISSVTDPTTQPKNRQKLDKASTMMSSEQNP